MFNELRVRDAGEEKAHISNELQGARSSNRISK